MHYRFLAVFGLKCNNCMSKTSLEDCDHNKTEETCPSGQDRCLTFTTELKLSNVTFKSFIRSCTSKEVCDNSTTFLQACRSVGGECEVSCCDKDLCNTHFAITLTTIDLTTAAAPTTAQNGCLLHSTASNIFIVACALAVLFA